MRDGKKQLGVSLEEFCQHNDVNLKTIVDIVESEVGLGDLDFLFLSGSVIDEGLGNTHSDLDLFIVTDRDLSKHYTSPAIAIPIGRTVIDLEWLRPGQINILSDNLKQFDRQTAGRDPRIALACAADALTVLHSVRIGIPLAGAEEFMKIRETIDYRAFLDIRFSRADVEVSNLQTDLAGFIEEMDEDGIRFAGRKLLGHVIDALLAAFGDTNPSEKWRFRKLCLLERASDNQTLTDTLFLTNFFRSLLEEPGREETDCNDWAYRCVETANQIIPLCQMLGKYPLPPAALKFVLNEVALLVNLFSSALTRKANSLPRLALNHQIRYLEGEFLLFKLRGRHALVLSDLARAALLFFDGTSTLQQTIDYLSLKTSASPLDLLQALSDLQTVLMAYDLASFDPIWHDATGSGYYVPSRALIEVGY